PSRRVVLLIDDPPDAVHPHDRAALERARRLPLEIQSRLDREALQYESSLRQFLVRALRRLDLRSENWHLARQYERVARWFERRASAYAVEDHTDRLFVEITFARRAREYRERLRDLWTRMLAPQAQLSRQALEREHRRLASVFRVQL